MHFFRKRDNKAKLAELLLSSGSLYKSGNDGSRKRHQSLDDIYGWSDQSPGERDKDSRIGLPALRIKKAS
jgi:hypothetical protein